MLKFHVHCQMKLMICMSTLPPLFSPPCTRGIQASSFSSVSMNIEFSIHNETWIVDNLFTLKKLSHSLGWTLMMNPIVMKCNSWDVSYVFFKFFLHPWLKGRQRWKKISFHTIRPLVQLVWRGTLKLNTLNFFLHIYMKLKELKPPHLATIKWWCEW